MLNISLYNSMTQLLEEYVNCTDLPEMPKAAIKAVLVARIEAKHADEGTRAW